MKLGVLIALLGEHSPMMRDNLCHPALVKAQAPMKMEIAHPSSAFGTFSPRGGEKGLDADFP